MIQSMYEDKTPSKTHRSGVYFSFNVSSSKSRATGFLYPTGVIYQWLTGPFRTRDKSSQVDIPNDAASWPLAIAKSAIAGQVLAPVWFFFNIKCTKIAWQQEQLFLIWPNRGQIH